MIVTAVATILRIWAFNSVGPNAFYDAAVRSMSLSWHNFFFGALEPGGRLAIDKAPADLWLQVASVKLFGFSGVATRLPECVAGIAAVPLLYDLVRRVGDQIAGLIAAATLAVLPTAILTAHSDTMDSLMMLLSVFAAWLVAVGHERRSTAAVVAAGAMVGLAFNVKLFEALLFVPALALLVVATGQGSTAQRVSGAAGAAAAAVVVGLGWIAVASLTPLPHRPWPFGSTNGSIWNVVFSYDGLGRLSTPASAAALRIDPPGPLRLMSTGGHDYAVTIGTALLAAVVLGLAAAAWSAAAWTVAPFMSRPPAPATSSRPPDETGDARLRIAGQVFFAAWLIIGVAMLSHMQRMQPRYLEAMTPAVAAVTGLGLARLASAPERAATYLLAACVATVAVAGALLTHPPIVATVVAIGAAIATTGLAMTGDGQPGRSSIRWAVALTALAAVLAVPASAAITTAAQHHSDAGLPSRLAPNQVNRLDAFLARSDPGARSELVSPTAMRAAPVIVRTGRPLLILTSAGGLPLATPHQLSVLVSTGRVKYALLGPDACSTATSGHCALVIRWAQHRAHDVSAAAGLPPQTLYRLASGGTRRRHGSVRAAVHRAGATRSAHRQHHRRTRA